MYFTYKKNMDTKEIKNNEEFNRFLSENNFAICKIGASWCGPCRQIEKIIGKLETEKLKGFNICELDAEDSFVENFCEEIGISSLPVLLFYKGGKCEKTIVGMQTPNVESIYNIINEII